MHCIPDKASRLMHVISTGHWAADGTWILLVPNSFTSLLLGDMIRPHLHTLCVMRDSRVLEGF